jgi:hypothetical protein
MLKRDYFVVAGEKGYFGGKVYPNYPKNNFLPFFAGLLINLKTSAG